MDDRNVTAGNENAPSFTEESDGILKVQDVVEHSVVDARVGQSGAVGDEIAKRRADVREVLGAGALGEQRDQCGLDVEGVDGSAGMAGGGESERAEAGAKFGDVEFGRSWGKELGEDAGWVEESGPHFLGGHAAFAGLHKRNGKPDREVGLHFLR